MLNKAIKVICFLFYTWCIYQSYFFIVAPISMYKMYDKEGYLPFYFIEDRLFVFIFIIPLFFIMLHDLPSLIQRIIQHWDISLMVSFPLGLLCALYYYVFTIWWKKQTIGWAWGIALIGLFFGPGVLCWFSVPGDGGKIEGLAAIIGVNLFYSILFIGNYLQKKYWPENKLCNRIRFILQWPCLKT